MRRAVAGAIEQEQRFGRVGQRDQQGMVAPLAVVGDVHAVLALGVGGHDGAIGIQDRFVEELGRLLSPDPEPSLVDGVHQAQDVGFGEAAAEVPGGGGVGNALGTQGVEIDLVVASQFEMLDPGAPSQDVEGDVEDVVGFVIGEVAFEKMEVSVDAGDQAGLQQDLRATRSMAPRPPALRPWTRPASS